jgi:hypothetical protein
MANDPVSRHRADQLDLVVGLEISHLVLNLTNYFKVVDREDQLHVDVDCVRNLP